MDFILNETEVANDVFKLVFPGDEIESADSSTAEDEMFIVDSDQEEEEEDRSFYRNFDNKEEYHRFTNQTKNPAEVVKETEYFEEDDLPELFDPEDREEINFGSFESDYDKASKF